MLFDRRVMLYRNEK